MTTLGHLTDDPRRSASNNAKARDDHVWGDDGTVQDAGVVFDNGHFSDDDVLSNVDMASDTCGLNDGAWTNVDMVPHSQW